MYLQNTNTPTVLKEAYFIQETLWLSLQQGILRFKAGKLPR